jgi:hypothetical protein
MKGFRTFVRRRYLPSTWILLFLAAASMLVAAPSAPAQQKRNWVFIRSVMLPPAKMCVDDTAPIIVVISTMSETAPPLQYPTYSATASSGTVSPGQGDMRHGNLLVLSYEATKEGQATISISAKWAGSGATLKPLHVTVIKCEYNVEMVALNVKKDPSWWWITSFEGSGGLGGSDSALQGTGTYDSYVDGLWKSKDQTVKCALIDAIEGSSSFSVSGTSGRGVMRLTFEFEPADVPASRYRCVGKDGKVSEEQMWPASSWSPHQEAKFASLYFPSAGGQSSFKFGSGGYGVIAVTRREQ